MLNEIRVYSLKIKFLLIYYIFMNSYEHSYELFIIVT